MLFTSSEAQIKFPQPSPTQTIQQAFGTGNIELVYSRPSAKGRRIFGDLVLFDSLWRTGANAPTKLTFTEPVEIGEKLLDTGSYVLYTVPHKDSWDIIINKGLKNWGVDGFKESEDIVRFKAIPVKIKDKIETFTMQFADVKAESCQLQLMWENTLVSFPITVKIKDKLKAQIEAALLTDKKPYWQAAQFYNEYDKNLPKALENISKAVEENPKAFYMYLYKAKIQKEMGDIAGALETSKKSLELSKEAGNNDYIRMNQKLQKELKQAQPQQ